MESTVQKDISTQKGVKTHHASHKTNAAGSSAISRPKLDGTRSSKEDVLATPPRSEGWKCEWRNGKIELNETSLASKDRSVINILIRTFTRTIYFEEGWLYAEQRCLLKTASGESVRIADIAYLTEPQHDSLKAGKFPVPAFVVEIVHDEDRRGKLRQKIAEYFANGVQCVWCIYLDSKRVRVYRSPQDSTLVRNNALCSAAPALPDLTLSAKDVFEYL